MLIIKEYLIHEYLIHEYIIMDHPNWGNDGSGYTNSQTPYDFGSFTQLLESGVYPENYPTYCTSPINSGLGDEGPSNFQQARSTSVAQAHEVTGTTRQIHSSSEGSAGLHAKASTLAVPPNELLDSDDETLLYTGTFGAVGAWTIQASMRIPQPFHTSPMRGRMYVANLANGCEKRFKRELGMPKDTFEKIVVELQQYYGWTCGRYVKDHVSCFEGFAMFMRLLRGYTTEDIQEDFQHSGDTVSRHVHKILNCMNRGFVRDKIQPTRHQDDPHPYLDTRDFYRPFKVNLFGLLFF